MTKHRKTKRISHHRRRAAAALLLGALALAALPLAQTSLAAHPAARGTINIGSKNFDEEYIIADMYQLLLEKDGFSVKQHVLGTTPLLQTALLRGDIDLYPEYTGTGVGSVLHHKAAIADPMKAYAFVKSGYRKLHLTWLAQSPMNDTNAIAVSHQTSMKYGLHKISDLAKVAGKLSFAALPDCKDRPDCLGGLKSVYGINFKNIQYVDSTTLTLQALRGGQVDVAEVFGTDGRINAYNLIALRDNKVIFPADHIAPVVRDNVLRKYPAIAKDLNKVAPYITDKAMIRLNAQFDLQHRDALSLARDFLKSKHLL